MSVNSKNKGSTFERTISKLLSKRFEPITGITTAFRKSVDSGSFFGGKNQVRTQTHNLETATFGDIICPSNFNYSVECKFYKEAPSFALVMEQNCKDWDKWIGQAQQDSKNCGKKMCIIVKYNRVSPIVILEEAVPNVFNMPYKTFFVVSLDHFLEMPDANFFS